MKEYASILLFQYIERLFLTFSYNFLVNYDICLFLNFGPIESGVSLCWIIFHVYGDFNSNYIVLFYIFIKVCSNMIIFISDLLLSLQNIRHMDMADCQKRLCCILSYFFAALKRF
jgi:hypothetical protein